MANILKSENLYIEDALTLEKMDERILYSIIHFIQPCCVSAVCDTVCDRICDVFCDKVCDEVCDSFCDKICDAVCDSFCDQICDAIKCDRIVMCYQIY